MPERFLVHADGGHVRAIGAVVEREDVFHASDELPVGLRWDRPALLQVSARGRVAATVDGEDPCLVTAGARADTLEAWIVVDLGYSFVPVSQ